MDLLSKTSRITAHDTAVLEAFLFLKGEPVSLQEIKDRFLWEEDKTIEAIQALSAILAGAERGIRIQRIEQTVQLVTKPELYEQLKSVPTAVLKVKPMAMEVLAIIAYKQPVTRQEIEQIRGVSSDRWIEQLLHQGLIEEKGRLSGPGKPIQYGTTPHFLTCTGLSSIQELLEGRELPETNIVEEINGTITESVE